jgi:hypothetical protein
MRLLVLILSSPGPIYQKFKENWKKCEHPSIDRYFIEYSESIPEDHQITEDSILIKGTDSFIPGCLAKTVQSLNLIDPTKYDYIIRTNLSSVIHFQRLIAHLETQATDGYYAGVNGKHQPEDRKQKYFTDQYPGANPNIIDFCSGALFIMSPDVAKVVASDIHYMDSPIIDDVYIGLIIQERIKGIELLSLNRMMNENVNVEDASHYNYRFKSNDRSIDIQRHLNTIELIYGGCSSDVQLITRPRIQGPKYDEAITEIDRTYKMKCNTPSDINEHLVTLRKYASHCQSVVECGTRSIVSSWAFLRGLLDGDSYDLSLVLCDLDISPNMIPLAVCARNTNVDFQFVKGNDLKVDLPEADLYFIDTWHVYPQLKRELNRFKSKAKQYIIMHDTTVDAIHGESVRCNHNYEALSKETGFPVEEIKRGLIPALEEFLVENPVWIRKEVFANNNGLTILERVSI